MFNMHLEWDIFEFIKKVVEMSLSIQGGKIDHQQYL